MRDCDLELSIEIPPFLKPGFFNKKSFFNMLKCRHLTVATA
jgi:hypothetical protein